MTKSEWENSLTNFRKACLLMDVPPSQVRVEKTILQALSQGIEHALQTLPENLVPGTRAKIYEEANVYIQYVLSQPSILQKKDPDLFDVVS